MNDARKRPLPEGWRWVRLGEVCEQHRQVIEAGSRLADELPYVSLEHVESNTGRLLKATLGVSSDEGRSTTFAFDPRHVLYGKLRPYLNKVALPDFQGRCTTELIPLLPKDGITREFLAWLLRRRETVDAVMQEKTGSRMPRADMDNLLALEIPLPPLPEQRRIAAILSEQMAAVERARAAAQARLEAAKALPASYLRAVFNSPEAQQWPRKRLGEVCEFKRGPFGGSLRKEIFVSDGYKLYEQQHAIQNNFEIGRYYITKEKYLEMASFAVIPGDIIISCSGTMGRVAIAPNNVAPGIINQALLKLTPTPDKVYAAFLKAYLETEAIQTRYFKLTAGSAIQNVASVTVLKDISVPVPLMPEQQRIAAILAEQMEAVDRLRKSLDEEMATINKLPAALLRRAFSGGL